MSLYEYGNDFFAYQQIGSIASARAVVPILLQHLDVRSVLDVGCGAGAWMSAYVERGITDVIGLDGGYLPMGQLLVEPSRFRAADVSGPVSLGRSFDLVQCLEVAEHLNPSASETLVDNLIRHAPMVLFSAAPPGQGGEHHVNERPYEYWRGLFAQRGYELFDFVRRRIGGRADVEPWYRYNLLLFVRAEAAQRLHPGVIASRIHPGAAVPDVSPPTYRIRKRLLSAMPVAAVSWLASVKHKLVLHRQPGAAS